MDFLLLTSLGVAGGASYFYRVPIQRVIAANLQSKHVFEPAYQMDEKGLQVFEKVVPKGLQYQLGVEHTMKDQALAELAKIKKKNEKKTQVNVALQLQKAALKELEEFNQSAVRYPLKINGKPVQIHGVGGVYLGEGGDLYLGAYNKACLMYFDKKGKTVITDKELTASELLSDKWTETYRKGFIMINYDEYGRFIQPVFIPYQG